MKKKSIFTTMIIGSVSVVIVIFLCFSVIFSKYLVSVTIDERAAVLENNVDKISELTYTALTNQSYAMEEMFQTIIDNISYNTQSSIMVFDNNGIVLKISGSSAKRGYNKVSPRVSDDVLSGKTVVSTELFVDEKGEKLMTVGSALKHGNEIFGGVIFNQRVPEIKRVSQRMFGRVLILIIAAMLFSAVLFYFISLKITTPVKKISDAVTEFSKGNFQKRVEYSSDDEFGELAENINQMASSLEELEKLRSSFISDVSHELRTPMTTISGFVEGILDGTIPKENHQKYLGVVLSESKRLSRLVTSLLQVSRLEGGKQKITKTVFDINELVCQALLKFEMMITEKSIDVELNLDDEKLNVFADRDSVTQVLINLINNAVKFTPNGGKITLSTTENHGKANICVKNTGHGIEPEKLKYIWDRFYKTDASRSEDRSGVGLGLYIVKRIISIHGETITANSVLDEYTEFTFTLALCEKDN